MSDRKGQHQIEDTLLERGKSMFNISKLDNVTWKKVNCKGRNDLPDDLRLIDSVVLF